MKKYKKQIYLFLYVSLFIVISSSAILYLNFRKQVKLQNEILKVEANMVLTDSLSNSLFQIESDKRGFLLTGDVSFLKNFYSLKINSSNNLEKLKKNIVDGTEAGNIAGIGFLLKERISTLDSGIIIFTTKGLGPAIDFMQLKSKKKIREDINVQIGLLKNDLQQKLKKNIAGIKARSKNNMSGFLLLLVIVILLMLIAAKTFIQSQQKVIKNHNKFKEAQRIAKIGSWEWDFATNKVTWSQEQLRLFGEDKKTFDGNYESYLGHLSEKDREINKALVQDALQGKKDYAVEHSIICKDGSSLIVFEQGTVLFDEDGKPTGMFGTTQDITEEKKTEEKLINLSNRLQLAVTTTGIGIWDWDIINDVTIWDDEVYRIYNVDKTNKISVSDSWKRSVHPGDLKRVNEELQKAIKGEEEYDTEFRVIWNDKTIHHVKGNGLVLNNNEGKPVRMIGTNTDITERKEAEEEILQLNKNLDQFANITAHDLQEPIRMVSGFLGLLYKKYNDTIDEQGQSYIYRAKDGADRMSILIKDLLEYSRSGNKAAKKELVDLTVVMDLVDRDLSIAMADTGTILRMPQALPTVNGSRSALYRLFLNLISNGIKFRKKDIIPEINLTINELPDAWEFTLQDNGIGIAEKDQSKLFQAFQRLHRREEYPGTGLGLVTCKKIVEMHGGKISMTSEERKGTAFHFTINKTEGDPPYQIN